MIPPYFLTSVTAQRLAAQRLGHDRLVTTILTGNPKLHYNVLSLSLGQVSCSGVLGALRYSRET